ncbi:MAG: S-layer homology domain-containing protein, partial [Monoglobaceae bacterium]
IKYSKTTTSSSNTGGGGAGGISANKPVAIGGLELPVTQTAEPETVNIFNDIEGVDWAHEAITALYNKGIIAGTGENRFEPDNPVTREQFVKIIIGAMNLQNEEEEVCGFADVDINQWYAKYVDIACAKGICRGVGDNAFGVGAQITRQDMAVMIYNALKAKGNAPEVAELPFEDSTEIADYSYEAVGALYGMGAVNGVSVTEFAPNANATRAEAAKMIYEVLDMLQ